MPVLSFRAKLLIAMMAVVLGVTGATLYATEKRLQGAYRRALGEQFEAQVSFFYRLQEARLARFKDACATLAKSVRLVRALEELGTEEVYAIAYDQFETAGLRGVRAGGGSQDTNVAADPAGAPPLLRFFNATGELLPLPEAGRPVVSGSADSALEGALSALGASLERWGAQEVGYLLPQATADAFLAYEVIATRVRDPVTHETMGAIVLGFPLADLEERVTARGGRIRSGLWLGGVLRSRTIPPDTARLLERVMDPGTPGDAPAPGEPQVPVEGVPHRLFQRLLNPGSAWPPVREIALYSLADLQEVQHTLRLSVLWFGALGILFALGASLAVSHSLSGPLLALVRGTREIARGNFEVAVPVRSRDELGQLTVAFNDMAQGLALKEKYRSLLNLVADREIAEELMRGGVRMGGEVRPATILFCDIRGFTAATQGMPPEHVIRMLNEHMTVLTDVVYAHGGVVDKFVGDLIMALFGAPRSSGADARRAAECALGMIKAREALNGTSAHVLRIGIGLASGQVVAGCMGSQDRLNYTVLGERVNLASRLCSQARAGEVVIDAATLDLLGSDTQTESMPPLKLKGFDQPVAAYRLLGLPPVAQPA